MRWLWGAAVAGSVHAAFSFYWAAGGGWLIDTLGERIAASVGDAQLLLLAAGLVKFVAAIGPLILSRLKWPFARLTRGMSWLAAGVLVVWGGLNTLIGNLVLVSVIKPSGGYDRPGMIGHAWLWDPLFLIWGVALALGLRLSSRKQAALNQ